MSRLFLTLALFCACFFLSMAQGQADPQTVIAISMRRANKALDIPNTTISMSTFAAQQPTPTNEPLNVTGVTTGDMVSPKFDSSQCLAVDGSDVASLPTVLLLARRRFSFFADLYGTPNASTLADAHAHAATFLGRFEFAFVPTAPTETDLLPEQIFLPLD